MRRTSTVSLPLRRPCLQPTILRSTSWSFPHESVTFCRVKHRDVLTFFLLLQNAPSTEPSKTLYPPPPDLKRSLTESDTSAYPAPRRPPPNLGAFTLSFQVADPRILVTSTTRFDLQGTPAPFPGHWTTSPAVCTSGHARLELDPAFWSFAKAKGAGERPSTQQPVSQSRNAVKLCSDTTH
jgi:hypothetical protein